MDTNRSSLPWRDRADFRELAVRKCLITYASALTSLFVDKECAIVRSHTSCDSHKYAWSRQHRIERKRLQSFSIRCPLCLMPVTVEILGRKVLAGKPAFRICGCWNTPPNNAQYTETQIQWPYRSIGRS